MEFRFRSDPTDTRMLLRNRVRNRRLKSRRLYGEDPSSPGLLRMTVSKVFFHKAVKPQESRRSMLLSPELCVRSDSSRRNCRRRANTSFCLTEGVHMFRPRTKQSEDPVPGRDAAAPGALLQTAFRKTANSTARILRRHGSSG